MTLHLPVTGNTGAGVQLDESSDPSGSRDPGSGSRRSRRVWALSTAVATLAVLAYVLAHWPVDAFGWGDLLWTAAVLIAAFVVILAAFRRAALAVTLAVLMVGAGLWMMSPRPAALRSGDPAILRYFDMFTGFHGLSAAVIDLNDPRPVHLANIGSTPATRFEIGSVSKALTGLVIADAVQRGEIKMTNPVSTYLPGLTGSPAAHVLIQELVTHHSGLAQFGSPSLRKAIWDVPLGRSFLTASPAQLTKELRSDQLVTRGHYAYSTLGAATAGQAAAAAAGMSYPELMRTRLFQPLGMASTVVQTIASGPMVKDGRAAMGRPIQPWVMDAYAPGGAVVSTSHDLAALALAILRGNAPGMEALSPVQAMDAPYRRIGTFWITSHWDNGQVVTWHSGGTAGYTAWIGLDRQHQRAAIVLSDDAQPVDELGEMLLRNSQ